MKGFLALIMLMFLGIQSFAGAYIHVDETPKSETPRYTTLRNLMKERLSNKGKSIVNEQKDNKFAVGIIKNLSILAYKNKQFDFQLGTNYIRPDKTALVGVAFCWQNDPLIKAGLKAIINDVENKVGVFMGLEKNLNKSTSIVVDVNLFMLGDNRLTDLFTAEMGGRLYIF